jgi:hypothetical protein
VRAELEKLRAPAEENEADEADEGAEGGEGDGGNSTAGKKTISFELSDLQAAIFDALGGIAWIKRELKKAEKAQQELPV